MIIKSADGFSVSIHEEKTRDVLDFLKQDIVNQINKGHTEADINNQFSSKYHFDNCQFKESVQNINNLYTNRVIPNLNPKGFGVILHIAMDFYSHSNWIEMDRTDLVDNGKGLWKSMDPLTEIVKGIVVVELNNIEDFNNRVDKVSVTNPKKTQVTLKTGEKYRGLISGKLPFPYPSSQNKCVPGNPGHWDTSAVPGLHKDSIDRVGYKKAVDLASDQIIHEWCRLVNLVKDRNGQTGVDKLYDTWVEDRAAMPDECIFSKLPNVFHINFESSHSDSELQGKTVGAFSLKLEDTSLINSETSNDGGGGDFMLIADGKGSMKMKAQTQHCKYEGETEFKIYGKSIYNSPMPSDDPGYKGWISFYNIKSQPDVLWAATKGDPKQCGKVYHSGLNTMLICVNSGIDIAKGIAQESTKNEQCTINLQSSVT